MENANPVSRRRQGWLGAMLTVLLLTVGCGNREAKPVAVEPIGTYFPIELGGRTVQLQFALTASEMQQGLMGRRDLLSAQGMIFVYRDPQQMGFWMHNTPTPLDIGFFTTDGILREVYPMYPFDENTVRSRRTDLLLAVEMPQGWFQAAGVKPGATLDLQAVAAAVKARGHDVRRFHGLAEFAEE